ncbi:TPA: hypothetical protein G8K93_001917 [Salmonella enterica]|nr:hypothetical protein [Salmonella enterica]
MFENTTTSCVRGPLRARPFRKVRLFLQSVLPLTLSAARETGLDEKSFTSEMPWALADALRDDFILD